MAALTAVASLLAPLLGSAARTTVWFSAAVVAWLLVLDRFAVRTWPGRPISLLRTMLGLTCVQPVFLMAAAYVDGDVPYVTTTGYYNHADQAWLVTSATIAMSGAMLAAAMLARGRARPAQGSMAALRDACSPLFLVAVSTMAFAHAFTRLSLLFFTNDLPLEVVYVLRLYLAFFLPVFVFLGFALQARLLAARVALGLQAGASAIVLLSGSRADALFPLAFAAAGYLSARTVGRATLARWVTVGGAVLAFAMFLGDAVRSDERGRTGEAAMARVDELGMAVSSGRDAGVVSNSVLRRLVSNSTHAVITRIPRELPYEDDGLVAIPEQLVSSFLPRLAYSGISETAVPRNRMLNQLGFLVDWTTSVELSMLADAWYRGGFAGLLVVGAIMGFVLQSIENLAYRVMRRRPEYGAVLIFCLISLIGISARDVVSGVRSLAYSSLAAVLLIALAALLRSRRATARRGAAALTPTRAEGAA